MQSSLSIKLRQLKYDCLWLHSARQFYLGLYRAFGHPGHLAQYHTYLHRHISRRGQR